MSVNGISVLSLFIRPKDVQEDVKHTSKTKSGMIYVL